MKWLQKKKKKKRKDKELLVLRKKKRGARCTLCFAMSRKVLEFSATSIFHLGVQPPPSLCIELLLDTRSFVSRLWLLLLQLLHPPEKKASRYAWQAARVKSLVSNDTRDERTASSLLLSFLIYTAGVSSPRASFSSRELIDGQKKTAIETSSVVVPPQWSWFFQSPATRETGATSWPRKGQVSR